MNDSELLSALNENLSLYTDDEITDLGEGHSADVAEHGEEFRSETFPATFRGNPIELTFRAYRNKPMNNVELQITDGFGAHIVVGNLEQDRLTAIQTLQWHKLEERWR